MGRFNRALIVKRLPLICINVLLLILAAIALIISARLQNALMTQQFVERWSASGRDYGQVSVFFADEAGLTSDSLESAVEAIDAAMVEAGVEGEYQTDGVPLWIYGYSSEGALSVTGENGSAEVSATGIGENFFMFHPLALKSGSYFYGSDLMHDRVVIDDKLAWQIFGATDVAGMELEIGGKPYVIAGVVSAADDFATAAAYGDKPRIFVPYEVLVFNDTEAKITSLERCSCPALSMASQLKRQRRCWKLKACRIRNTT